MILEKKINTAIIGFGLSGQSFHAPILNCLSEFNISKIMTNNLDSTQLIHNRYQNVEVVSQIDDVLNDSKIELVIITSPNIYHFDHVKQALFKNKHVVVEKPITTNSIEADELIELARKQGKLLSVYHNRRFDSDFKTIKKLLDEKKLGRVIEYEAHFDRFRNFLKDHAWKETEQPGSGIVYDLGSHLIDQALVLFGMPKTIYADIRKQREGSLIDDAIELIMDYGQLKAIIKAGMLVKAKLPRYTILGDQGAFVKFGIDPQEAVLRNGGSPFDVDYGKEIIEDYGDLYTLSQDEPTKVESEVGDYRDYYRNIYDAIVNQTEPYVTAKQARDVIFIIECAYESNKLKKVIQL